MNSYTGNTTSTQSQVALHLMINQLSVSTLPTAMRRQSIIVNDIPQSMYVNTDAHKLAAVLGTLLNTVITHTSNTYIHISAKNYGDVMLLHIKENSRLNSPSFAGKLAEIQEMAEHIGGNVSVTSYRNEITTVAFSFVNTPVMQAIAA
jgi:hypothetical protein